MTSTIITKNSSTASSVPSSGSLTQGELAVNVTDKKLYTKDSGGTVVKLVGSLGNQEASAAAITGGSINGTTVGASTASTGAFTTLSASSTVSGTGFSTYLASPPAIGGTAAAAGSFTTLSASGNVTLSGGTANGVAYLNGSKVVTSGSALTFDGSSLALGNGVTLKIDNDDSLTFGTFSLNTSGTLLTGGTSSSLLKYVGGGLRQEITTTGVSIWSVGGSEAMRLTSTGLGIGTSSPSYKLQVASGSTANNAYFSSTATTAYTPTAYNGDKARLFLAGGNGTGATNGIEFTGGGSNENYFGVVQESGGSGAFVFQTYNGSAYGERLRLDSSGNLGLGVTPSAWSGMKAFQLGDGVFAMSSDGAGSGDGSLTWNGYYNGTNWIYGYTGGVATRYRQNESGHAWFTAPSGTAGNAITFTQAMTLDANGRLGIGVTSPGYALDVGDTAGGNMFRFTRSGVELSSFISAGIPFFGTTSNTALVLMTNSTERCRIDSSGSLLVGTTSATSRTGVTAKTVSYTTTEDATYVSVNDNSFFTVCSHVRTTSGTRYHIGFGDGTTWTERGTISTNGSSTTYSTSSDYRLKNTIAPMTGALAKVALLKPCTYKWNADGSDGEGFIAHELAEVVPQCVTGEKDAVDEDGNPKYQGIDTSFLVATLTAAIQELKAEFDAYKASHP